MNARGADSTECVSFIRKKPSAAPFRHLFDVANHDKLVCPFLLAPGRTFCFSFRITALTPPKMAFRFFIPLHLSDDNSTLPLPDDPRQGASHPPPSDIEEPLATTDRFSSPTRHCPTAHNLGRSRHLRLHHLLPLATKVAAVLLCAEDTDSEW